MDLLVTAEERGAARITDMRKTSFKEGNENKRPGGNDVAKIKKDLHAHCDNLLAQWQPFTLEEQGDSQDVARDEAMLYVVTMMENLFQVSEPLPPALDSW